MLTVQNVSPALNNEPANCVAPVAIAAPNVKKGRYFCKDKVVPDLVADRLSQCYGENMLNCSIPEIFAENCVPKGGNSHSTSYATQKKLKIAILLHFLLALPHSILYIYVDFLTRRHDSYLSTSLL